jgi:hypothetical protein
MQVPDTGDIPLRQAKEPCYHALPSAVGISFLIKSTPERPVSSSICPPSHAVSWPLQLACANYAFLLVDDKKMKAYERQNDVLPVNPKREKEV